MALSLGTGRVGRGPSVCVLGLARLAGLWEAAQAVAFPHFRILAKPGKEKRKIKMNRQCF